jgi:tetratricopeptide (TPR) repeat protein
MTDDIITQLAKVRGIKVISRTSTARFRDRDRNVRQIGQQLGATVILEGSVRRAADRVRIVVQLIDAADDKLVWGETYDRELTDVFSVQSDVALSIAGALEAQLSPEERNQIKKQPTQDLTAYDLYLLGRFYWNERTDVGIRRAIEYFSEATERDTQYALAYAGQADAYLFAGLGYATIPPADAMPRSQAAARKALDLDAMLPEAHTSLGHSILMYDWDVDRAKASLERAIEINPNHAPAHQWLAWCQFVRGRYAEAFDSFEKALALNPLSHVLVTESGWPFSYAGMHEQALLRYKRALEINPEFALAHYNVGMSYHSLGRIKETLGSFERAVELSGGMAIIKGFLAVGYADAGREKDARHILDELTKQAGPASGVYIPLAIVCEALGELEEALDWLEKAYVDREPFFLCLPMRNWIELPRLRNHPRFEALIERLGIAPHDLEEQQAKLKARIRD